MNLEQLIRECHRRGVHKGDAARCHVSENKDWPQEAFIGECSGQMWYDARMIPKEKVECSA